MKAPELIETSRLWLRPPARGDAQAILERYAGDAEVTRHLSWPTHHAVADTLAFIDLSTTEWNRWPAGPYLIFSRADGALLGGTGLLFETPHRAETGYVLARDAWGHGYATEALKAMVDVASQVGVQRLYALCLPEHHASQRVLEKGGFEPEGTLRRYTELPNLEPGVPRDMLCWSVVFE